MAERFEFDETPLRGVFHVRRKPIGDSRGYLTRFFCREEFGETGFDAEVLQINHTLTRERGTVRGLHYQVPPYAETKLVSCIRGEVFDVAVDVRADSPTFLHWHGEVLSADQQNALLIPEGFCHGFQSLAEDCEMMYLHTALYQSGAEAALNATDPQVGIKWPLEITVMSDRDRGHLLVDDDFAGVRLP